jgi:hypothetical protein
VLGEGEEVVDANDTPRWQNEGLILEGKVGHADCLCTNSLLSA